MLRLNNGLTWLFTSAAGLLGLLSSEHLGSALDGTKPAHVQQGAAAKAVPRPRRSPSQSQGLTEAHKACGGAAEQDGCPAESERYVGVILPGQASDVIAIHAGTVEQVHVALGDRVEQGQLLVSMSVEQARLDRVRAEAESAAARAALARAEVEQEHASTEAKSTRRLAGEGLASEQEASEARFRLRQSRNLAAEAQSLVKERDARAEQLRAIEEDANVSANFAGVVAVRYADAGAQVGAGAPLLRLISDGDLVVRFAIPERDGEPELQIGQPVFVEPGESQREAFRATVVRLSPEIDSASRMRTVEAVPDDQKAVSERGWVGSIVTVRPVASLPAFAQTVPATHGEAP